MSVVRKPVPDLGDFMEVISRFDRADLAILQHDITAYEQGKPMSAGIEDVIQRAECLMVANKIIERYRLSA